MDILSFGEHLLKEGKEIFVSAAIFTEKETHKEAMGIVFKAEEEEEEEDTTKGKLEQAPLTIIFNDPQEVVNMIMQLCDIADELGMTVEHDVTNNEMLVNLFNEMEKNIKN